MGYAKRTTLTLLVTVGICWGAGAANAHSRRLDMSGWSAGGADWVPPSRVGSAFSLGAYLEGDCSPLEQSLLADAADGRWDQFSLLTAALVASGVHCADRLQHYERLVGSAVGQLQRTGQVKGTQLERAQAVFEFMHARFLWGGYQLDRTDLALTLDEGKYNCVTASVLFHVLACRFGLAVWGLEMTGHAMCRLAVPGGTIDVETTCPTWFRLMHDPAKQAALLAEAVGGSGAGLITPARAVREVSPVELVATIYYNRGVDLLAERQYALAASANAKALRLDPANPTARGNLVATLNNWAIALARVGRCDQAVGLLRQGLALDPGMPALAANFAYAHQQWVERLCQAGRFQEALDQLAQAARERPAEPLFRQSRCDTYRRWIEAERAAGRPEVADHVAQQMANDPLLADPAGALP